MNSSILKQCTGSHYSKPVWHFDPAFYSRRVKLYFRIRQWKKRSEDKMLIEYDGNRRCQESLYRAGTYFPRLQSPLLLFTHETKTVIEPLILRVIVIFSLLIIAFIDQAGRDVKGKFIFCWTDQFLLGHSIMLKYYDCFIIMFDILFIYAGKKIHDILIRAWIDKKINGDEKIYILRRKTK